MTTQGCAVGRDAHGRAVLTSSAGQQVMMEWECEYMERCVDALGIRAGVDRVLEIGFGLAYSAARVQSYSPRRHTIVECDEAVLARADAFAASRSSVEVIRGTWQARLPALGEFDCFFFDDFPLPELQPPHQPRRSRWHDFLDAALAHAAPGARISGYLARPLRLRRAGCTVQLRSVHVQVPSNCEYFPTETALVPLITVVDPAAAQKQIETRHRASNGRSRRFLRAFEKARAAQDGAEQDAWYDDDGDGDGDSKGEEDRGAAAGESESCCQRYADAEGRRTFLQSLRQARARSARASDPAVAH